MIALELDHVYTLKPTFAALLALEEATGTGLVALARRFAEGTFTLAELLAVIRSGLVEPVPSDLAEQLGRKGIAALTPVVGAYLHAALTGELPPGKA